MTGALFYILPS